MATQSTSRHLLLLMLVLCCSSNVSGELWMTVLGSHVFSIGPADFGLQLEEGQVYEADLSLPPKGAEMLCEYPESLEAAVDPRDVVEFQRPIALLVSQGRCGIDQKARVGLALHQKFSHAVKYLIVYNNDTSYAILVPPLTSESVGEAKEDFDALGFLSVSTIRGASLQALLWRRSDAPHLSPDGAQATLPIRMENIPDEEEDPPFSSSTPPFPPAVKRESNRSSHNLVTLFIFVLIGIFVGSPCIHVAHLWWAGGGRIVFRHDEHGRVIGLQYISPRQHWFFRGRNNNEESQERNQDENLLSAEQVLQFPEIIFKPESKCERSTIRNDEESSIPDLTTTSDDENQCSTESTNVRSSLAVSEYRTTSTTCSICIEDFEPNECIRVLPRCRHGFHTACLMPWLTERSACCPLCKTNVLPDDNDDHKKQMQSQQAPAEESSASTDQAQAHDAQEASSAQST